MCHLLGWLNQRISLRGYASLFNEKNTNKQTAKKEISAG